MRVLITGKTKLAGALIERMGDVQSCRVNDNINWDKFDVFLNCAHVGFSQVELLFDAYENWKNDKEKLIINFSSRAYKPNISRGLMYSSQKAALNHLCDNIVYNTDCKCAVVVINLGLLESSLPSTKYYEICELVEKIISDFKSKKSLMTEVTFQHKHNYTEVQEMKIAENMIHKKKL